MGKIVLIGAMVVLAGLMSCHNQAAGNAEAEAVPDTATTVVTTTDTSTVMGTTDTSAGQASIVSEKVQTDISNFKFKSGLSHPYIPLDTKRIAELRSGLASTHSYLWNRYLQDLPYMLSVSKREIPLDDARYDGDLISELAFAWLMTGRDDILNIAKFQLLCLAREEKCATKKKQI